MYRIEREVTFRALAEMVRGLPIAVQLAKHYKQTAGVDLQIVRALTGTPGRIRFVAQVDSLDEWNRVQDKIAQDPAFQKLLGEFAPLIEGTKTYDQIWSA